MSKKKDILISVILVAIALLIIPRILDKSKARMDKIDSVINAMEEQDRAIENELRNAKERLGVVLKKDMK